MARDKAVEEWRAANATKKATTETYLPILQSTAFLIEQALNHGFSVVEVADVLGVSSSWVRQIARHGAKTSYAVPGHLRLHRK
jgi:AraC-like DNA-binding protein